MVVRHLKAEGHVSDFVPFDLEGHLEGASYWDFEKGAWVEVPRVNRFWLPLGPERAYEEGLAQYTSWVEGLNQEPAGTELVVVSMDLGLLRGSNTDPWNGWVMLGAFRGELAAIEPGVDEPLEWLKWVRGWIAKPESRWSKWPEVVEEKHG